MQKDNKFKKLIESTGKSFKVKTIITMQQKIYKYKLFGYPSKNLTSNR